MKIKKTYFYLAIVAIGITACQNNHAVNNVAAVTADSTSALLDSNQVSEAEARAYVKNYAKRAGFVDSTYSLGGRDFNKKVPDTRCVWFDIKRLEKLVKDIKAEGGDGIRFYYAAYDSTYKANVPAGAMKPEKVYWNHNTLLMVSTKDSLVKKTHYHRDYYTKTAKGNKGILMTVPENRGELCPPPTPCKSVGATLIDK